MSPKGARTAAKTLPIEHSLLLTATLCLLAFGVVMVFSASSTTSLLGESGDSAYYLKRTVIFGALGLVVMHLLARRGVSVLRPLTPLLLAGAFFLCLVVMVPGVGVEVNGSRAWLAAGPLQIQPSELMKIALILFCAQLLAIRPKLVHGGIAPMFPVLCVVGLAVVVVGVGDLGTALVTCLAITALLIGAGARLRDIALLAAAAAAVVLLAVLIEPYRVARITSFLDPGGDPGGAGFQLIQAKIALGSGGLFGVGLGESLQKAFYLPEAHTDMIAAVIGEELGMVGIGALVGLYGLFGYAGFRIAQSARDRYGKLLAAGLTSMVLVQALVNLLAVFGLAPLTGVPLPFVSYGNASMLVMLAAVGLLLNVSRGGSARSGAKPSSDDGRLRVVDGGYGAGQALARCPRGAPHAVAEARKQAVVVIAAGGTAGHVVPALAVADALRAEGASVSFLGADDRAEAEVVPAAGYEIDLLRVRGLDRRNPIRAAGALRLAAAAVPEARRVLRERGAEAVLGGGGYVAGPAGLAAVRLGLPLVLTEADRHLGMTNRMLARRAHRVCLAFPIDGLDGPRYVVTGRPVPAAIANADRDAARERFGIAAADRCLLVFGGSQGARSINLCALEAFAGAAADGRDFHVLHISGSRDYEIARETLDSAPNAARYTLLEYEPGLADALAACDLVLARSGGSIFEIAAAGRAVDPGPLSVLGAAPPARERRAGWRPAAPRSWSRTPSSSRRGCASSPASCSAIRRASGGWPRPRAALARPDAAQRVAAELLAAVGENSG